MCLLDCSIVKTPFHFVKEKKKVAYGTLRLSVKPTFQHKQQECVEHEIKTTVSEIKTRSQSLLDYWVSPSLE